MQVSAIQFGLISFLLPFPNVVAGSDHKASSLVMKDTFFWQEALICSPVLSVCRDMLFRCFWAGETPANKSVSSQQWRLSLLHGSLLVHHSWAFPFKGNLTLGNTVCRTKSHAWNHIPTWSREFSEQSQTEMDLLQCWLWLEEIELLKVIRFNSFFSSFAGCGCCWLLILLLIVRACAFHSAVIGQPEYYKFRIIHQSNG